MLESSLMDTYDEATSALTDFKWRHGIPQDKLLAIFRKEDNELQKALKKKERTLLDIYLVKEWLTSLPSLSRKQDLEKLAGRLEYRTAVRYGTVCENANECCFLVSGSVTRKVTGTALSAKLVAGDVIGNERLLFSKVGQEKVSMTATVKLFTKFYPIKEQRDDDGEEEFKQQQDAKGDMERRKKSLLSLPVVTRQKSSSLAHGPSSVVDADLVVYTALEPCELAFVTRADYDELMRASDYEALQDSYFLLSRLFKTWSTVKIVRLAKLARIRRAPLGTYLVRQGEVAESLLLLKKGACRVEKYLDVRGDLENERAATKKELDSLTLRYTYHYTMRKYPESSAVDRIERLKRKLAQLDAQLDAPNNYSLLNSSEPVGIMMPPGLCGEGCLFEKARPSPTSVVSDTIVEYYEVDIALFNKMFELDDQNFEIIARRSRNRKNKSLDRC